MERDQPWLRPLRAARGEHGCPVEAEVAREDRKVSKGTLMPGHRTARWKCAEIFSSNGGEVGCERAGNQTNVPGDLQPTHERRCGRAEQTALHRSECEGVSGADGGAKGLSVVSVQPARHVRG